VETVALPIDPHLPRLVAAVAAGNVVLVAPPGAGKTTRLPPALIACGVAGEAGKVMLEPRRVAARASASNLAGHFAGAAASRVVGSIAGRWVPFVWLGVPAKDAADIAECVVE
jgi:ATP-dependent helicase HrpB